MPDRRRLRVGPAGGSIDLPASALQLVGELKDFFTSGLRRGQRIFFFRVGGRLGAASGDSRATNPLPTKMMKNMSFICAVKTRRGPRFAPEDRPESQARKAVERLRNRLAAA
jgi:hypothetical protein